MLITTSTLYNGWQVRLQKIIWAPSSEFVYSSIPSWHILTAHAQPVRGARDLAFCLKVPLDSLLVWASSEGSGETARMRRLAWTFAARIGDKYQIRLTRSICNSPHLTSILFIHIIFSLQNKYVGLLLKDLKDSWQWKVQHVHTGLISTNLPEFCSDICMAYVICSSSDILAKSGTLGVCSVDSWAMDILIACSSRASSLVASVEVPPPVSVTDWAWTFLASSSCLALCSSMETRSAYNTSANFYW